MIQARWPASSVACSSCAMNERIPLGSGLRRMLAKQVVTIFSEGTYCFVSLSYR